MKTTIFNSIDELGEDFPSHFVGSELDFSYGLLKAIEKSIWGDLFVCYLVVEDNVGPAVFSPVFIGSNLNINTMLPRSIQEGYLKLVRHFGNHMKTRFVIAGSIISDKGWIPLRKDLLSNEDKAHSVVSHFLSSLDELAIAHRAKIAMVKDIHESFPEKIKSCFGENKYKALQSLPTVTINTDFIDFEGYMSSLTKNSRKHCRKVLKPLCFGRV